METIEKVIIKDCCIGEVQWGPDSDFPWAKGVFTPSPEFERFAKYFRPFPNKDGARGKWLQVGLLSEDGIASSDLIFENTSTGEKSYICGIVLFEDGTASWQFSLEPLDETV